MAAYWVIINTAIGKTEAVLTPNERSFNARRDVKALHDAYVALCADHRKIEDRVASGETDLTDEADKLAEQCEFSRHIFLEAQAKLDPRNFVDETPVSTNVHNSGRIEGPYTTRAEADERASGIRFATPQHAVRVCETVSADYPDD